MTEKHTDELAEIAKGTSSRRSLLKLGAIAAPTVVSLRSAWAGQYGGAATSLAMCQIPLDQECDKDGKLRNQHSNPNKEYFAPPTKGYYYGQELIEYQTSGTLPDSIFSVEQFDAHLNYIRNLKPGDSGFTCLTSLVHKL